MGIVLIEPQKTGLELIPVTVIELQDAIAASTLIPGDFYQVSFIDVANFTNTVGIFQAVDVNKISLDGSGLFWNPNYFSTFGIWNNAALYAIGDRCIWNNRVYENTTGNNPGQPDLNPGDFTELPGSAANGYILESCVIKYDVVNDLIIQRQDTYNNNISKSFASGSLKLFAWGRETTVINNIGNNTNFSICNAPIDLLFKNNICNTSIIGIFENSTNNNFGFNTISNCSIGQNSPDFTLSQCEVLDTIINTIPRCVFNDSIFISSELNTLDQVNLAKCNLQNTRLAANQNLFIQRNSFFNCDINNCSGAPGTQNFIECKWNSFNLSGYTFNGFDCYYSEFNKSGSKFYQVLSFNNTPAGNLDAFNFPIGSFEAVKFSTYTVLVGGLNSPNPLNVFSAGFAALPNAAFQYGVPIMNGQPFQYQLAGAPNYVGAPTFIQFSITDVIFNGIVVINIETANI